ncbi:MAG: tetratricopeptide repeat protein, partial [Candidatus Methanomethylophilaceae archaeon]
SGIDKKMRRASADYDACLSKLRSFVNDVQVCRRFIDITFDWFPQSVVEVSDRISELTDDRDIGIMLYLADRLVDVSHTERAERILEGLCPGQDLALIEFVRGKLAYMAGDTESARQHFLRTVLTDPCFFRAYPYLDILDPAFGWLHMANIWHIRMDEDVVLSDGLVGGEREDLCDICRIWHDGDWNGAMAAMRRLPSFVDRDPFTLAQFARMSADLGSQRDAIDAYVTALETLKDSEYLMIELASVYESIGEYDSAASLLGCARVFDPNCGRILVVQHRCLVDWGRRQDAEGTLTVLLTSPGADAEWMDGCADVLRSHDMVLEATNLVKKVSSRCIDRCYSEYILAKDCLSRTDYRSAIHHANQALKHDRKDIRSRCIRAKAHLHANGMDKAMRDVNSMTDDSPDDVRVLDVKKDIYRHIGQYQNALDICDDILSIEPRNAAVMIDRAEMLGQLGDHKNSLDAYREALNIREDISLFISILKNLLKQRYLDDLCRLVDDFDDTFGSSVIVWRLRGNAEYLAGRYEDAAVSYGKAVMLSPNEAVIWHSKGMAEEAAEMYQEAEDSFGKAILIDLDNTDYWISKAIVQEKRGNYKGAISSLNRVITSAGSGVFPLAMKARLLARFGKDREALYFLEQAQKMEPSNADIMRMRKDALIHTGEYVKALELCKMAVSLVPGDQTTLADMVSLYLLTNDRKGATDILNGLVLRDDLSKDTLVKCSSTFHQLGDFEREAAMMERANAIDPGDREVLLSLAGAYTILGNKDAAEEIYTGLEESDPDDVSITVKKVMLDSDAPPAADDEEDAEEEPVDMMGLADAARSSGRQEEAMHIYRSVLDSDPDNTDAYIAVSEIMIDMGELTDAIGFISDATHTVPNDPRLLKILGDSYYLANDPEKAADAYTDAMKLGMDTAELHESAGHALEDMGMMQMALDNYRKAASKDPLNIDYKLCVASLEHRVGHERNAEEVINDILAVEPGNMTALKMFVTIRGRMNDSEAIMAMYDDIVSACGCREDAEFFAFVLRDVGEHSKADLLLSRFDTV